MSKRTLMAVAGLLLIAACGGGGDNEAGDDGEATGAGGDGIGHGEEVVPVIEYGFGGDDVITYGFVFENISDQAALGVRVHVSFYDEAGDEVVELSRDHDYSVVLPGEQMGGGDSRPYTGDRTLANMGIAVTLITALDDPDAYPAPEHGEPVPDPERSTADRQVGELTITNTDDVALTPVVHHVLRTSDGVIVGGVAEQPVAAPIQPGTSGTAEIVVDTGLVGDAEADVEVYVDPNLAWPTVATPLWEEPAG